MPVRIPEVNDMEVGCRCSITREELVEASDQRVQLIAPDFLRLRPVCVENSYVLTPKKPTDLALAQSWPRMRPWVPDGSVHCLARMGEGQGCSPSGPTSEFWRTRTVCAGPPQQERTPATARTAA